MNKQTDEGLCKVYNFIKFRLFYIVEPTHQLPEVAETMVDDDIDKNATKELCDPLRTTHEG